MHIHWGRCGELEENKFTQRSGKCERQREEMKFSASTAMFYERQSVKCWYVEDPPLLGAVVIGMERWVRTSERVWRYKIGEKRMCALSQLKSCQAAGAYKLQAKDKRQLCLSGCFPLHLSCPLSPLLSSLVFSLLHHGAGINQGGNGKAVC